MSDHEGYQSEEDDYVEEQNDVEEAIDIDRYCLEYDFESLVRGDLEKNFEQSSTPCRYHEVCSRKTGPCVSKKVEKVLGLCKKHCQTYIKAIVREHERKEAKKAKKEKTLDFIERNRDSYEEGVKFGEETAVKKDFNKLIEEQLQKDLDLVKDTEDEELEDIDELTCKPSDIEKIERCGLPPPEPEAEDGFQLVEWDGTPSVKIVEDDEPEVIQAKLEAIEREKKIRTIRQSINIDLVKECYFDLWTYACLKSSNPKARELPKILKEDPSTKSLFGPAIKELGSDLKIDFSSMPSYASLALRHGYIAMKVLMLD